MSRLARLGLLLIAATTAGCVYPALNTSTTDTGGSAGGIPGVGGAVALGGVIGSGGVRLTGGIPSTGGVPHSGGINTTGGHTGGVVASGGAVTGGGVVPAGGIGPTAGSPGKGGTAAADGGLGGVSGGVALGGAVGSGGVAGARGVDARGIDSATSDCGNACTVGQRCSGGACVCDEVSCPKSCCNGNVCATTQTAAMCGILGAQCGACGPTGSTVTFNNGKAAGAMTGWGWVALGPQDTITDPKCQGQAITAAAPCLSVVNWNSSNAFCLTGSIPAVAATNPDYTDNWGVQIGVNATINTDGTLGNFGQTLGQSFTSIAITVTGSPLSGLRVLVHRHGDPNDTAYCAALTSGVAIPLVAFNTKCWDFPPDGVALTAADVPNIDEVAVQVSSVFTPITVTNLCIAGITFSSGALSACAPTPPGGGCMNAGYLSCGDGCCPSTAPYACSLTSKCYATQAEAVAACGSTACSTCVAPSNVCTPSPGGTCNTSGYLYCSGTTCCPPSLPFYCPMTGLCYPTAAAAFAACGNTACSTCVGA